MNKRYNNMEAYMHLLDDRPAWFNGNQIVFATRKRFAVPLVDDLKEIRANRIDSYKFLSDNGYDTSEMDYGHLRVHLIPVKSGRQITKFQARCEECAATKVFKRGDWPKGWSQMGRSRFGKRYQKSGIARHCPKHNHAVSITSK